MPLMFDFNNLLQFSTSPFVLPIPLAFEMVTRMGQGLCTSADIHT